MFGELSVEATKRFHQARAFHGGALRIRPMALAQPAFSEHDADVIATDHDRNELRSRRVVIATWDDERMELQDVGRFGARARGRAEGEAGRAEAREII